MNFICNKALPFFGIKHEFCDQIKNLEADFADHVSNYGISYATKAEHAYRFSLFVLKDKELKRINSNPKNTFTVGHNMFSTWDKQELKQMLGYGGGVQAKKTYGNFSATSNGFDWRSKGGVNPVKDQAHCGSCWAFSATAATENAHFRSTGDLISLSEQELVSCDTSCQGCNGGWQYRAFDYLKEHPQNTETNYPYSSGKGVTGNCDTSLATGDVSVQNYANVPERSANALKGAIEQGVVSVTVEADQEVFHHYTGGIINSDECGTNLDHAIAAVGWGTDDTVGDYYIVRNSWTTAWGEQGYVRIAAVENTAGICGIQLESTIPTTN